MNTVLAQGGGFGGSQGGYGGSQGGGRRGNQGMSNSGMDKHSDINKEKSIAEDIDKTVAKLKTELTLDELQVIAIKNVLTDSMKDQEILMKKEASQEDKTKEMQALSDSTDLKILNFLYKNQKDKYKAFIQERKTKMESASLRRR
jgi:hypothetical protein